MLRLIPLVELTRIDTVAEDGGDTASEQRLGILAVVDGKAKNRNTGRLRRGDHRIVQLARGAVQAVSGKRIHAAHPVFRRTNAEIPQRQLRRYAPGGDKRLLGKRRHQRQLRTAPQRENLPRDGFSGDLFKALRRLDLDVGVQPKRLARARDRLECRQRLAGIRSVLMGAGVVVLISSVVGEENFLSWGWRLPFFLALPLGLIGLYLRHALEETPAFQQHVDKLEQGDREGLQDGPKVSFKEIATKHWRSLLTCIGLVIATNVTYYMLLTYMPSYLSHNLHYSEDHGVLIIIAIMIGMLFVQPVMGLLSDRFGRRPFVLLGSVALFVLAIPAFILINSNVIGLIFAGLLMLAVILNCFTGVMASTLPAMFPTHIRYSALAAAFNISVLVAGLTPTLAASLVESTQNLMMPAYYLMVIAVIGLATGLTMKETANRPLKGATPAASDIQEAKEILREHYDNVEQKIENIDAEIEELQKKRSRLVDQHPRINE